MKRLRTFAGWLPALVLVPAVVVAGILVTVPDDDLAAMREVQPLDLGTTWVYDVLDHGEPSGTRTTQVVGSASLIDPDGGLLSVTQVRRTYTDYPGSGPRSFIAYLGLDGRTLLQYAQEESDRWFEVSPPTIANKLPAEVGSAWSYEGTVGDQPYSFETELTEIVDVTASGRIFEGCAHYVSTIHLALDDDPDNDPDTTEILDEWTCSGYGTVKARDRIEATGQDYTEELTEFHGVAANWHAEGHEPVAPEGSGAAPGWTEGFDLTRSYAVPDGTLGRQLAWTDLRPERALLAPVSDGEVMVYVEPDGSISLRTTDTGEMRWRLQLRGPILAPPVVTAGVVVVADSLKRVWALSTTDGRALWVHELPDVVSASPAVVGDLVVVPSDDGSLTAFGTEDGEEAWQVELGGAVRTSPAYDGEHLLTGDGSGTLSALEPDDGTVAWSASLDSGLAQGPLVTDGRILVQDNDGVTDAFLPGGDLDWQSRRSSAPTAPMTAANGVVVTSGTYEDIAAFDTTDGHRLWTRRLPNTRSNPTVVGNEVVFVTRHGEVEVLGLGDGRRIDHWTLPLPVPDGDWFVDVSTALVDDALVITAASGGDITDEALFAYPVGPGGEQGPELHLVGRQTPGVPTEPPVLVGDDVVMSGIDGVYRVGPDGSATQLTSIDDRIQTGAAVSDGIVVAPHGEVVQGVRLDDGTLLWESPSGAPSYGAVPAVDDDTVAYAIADVGLAAVDLHTGERRWAKPIENLYSTTSPLLLPDGDVLYGGGGLARFDGETGEVKWRDPEAHFFGPPAFADGVVYGIGLSPTEGTGAMMAVDAATGDRLWSQPATDPPLFLAAAAAEGVVVAYDANTAHAYDTATGEELWSVHMNRAAGGSPYIDHGRVFLTEFGSGHNVNEQDFRVSIHDLHTGRFLGAFEPVGMPAAPQPNVAGAPGGKLLVPTSLQLLTLEAR